MATNNAYLPNIEPAIAGKIAPMLNSIAQKNKQCAAAVRDAAAPSNDKQLLASMKLVLRLIDEQDAINRFTWYNLPDDIDGQLLERMLYYHGQVCLFYDPTVEKFCVLPYALDGDIDIYGRYITVHPIPFYGGKIDELPKNTRKKAAAQAAYLSTLHLKPLYTEMDLESLLKIGPKALTEYCVILKDYSEQRSQEIIPRQQVNDPILDLEAICLPFMRTALLRGTGVKGMKVGHADEATAVERANQEMFDAALEGRVNIPIVGKPDGLDFQELNDGVVGKSEEFMLAMQSIDNFRLSTYGLDNGGLFQKKQHMLQSEQDMNAAGGGSVGLIYQDSLTRRQRWCDIVNSLFPLGVACAPAEAAVGGDRNGDGEISDLQDMSGTQQGQQPQEVK